MNVLPGFFALGALSTGGVYEGCEEAGFIVEVGVPGRSGEVRVVDRLDDGVGMILKYRIDDEALDPDLDVAVAVCTRVGSSDDEDLSESTCLSYNQCQLPTGLSEADILTRYRRYNPTRSEMVVRRGGHSVERAYVVRIPATRRRRTVHCK